MKNAFLILTVALLTLSTKVQAAESVKAQVSYEGDTFNFELSGQKNWDYDVKRVVENNRTKVQLLVKSLDKSTLENFKNITNPFVESIKTVPNAIDNKWMVEFTLKNNNIETFDYLTDQPSKLILDFYASENPQDTAPEKAQPKKSGAGGKRQQFVNLDIDKDKKVERHPADVDYLQIKPDGGIETSFLSHSGLFDAGDSQFRRFNISESEYKDESVIRSRSNYYLKFPELETEFSFWKKMKENPPEYEIKPDDTAENKEARLLRTLFTKKRYMVFLQTYDWFIAKYPTSKFSEMLAYMKGDALLKMAEESKEGNAYDQAQNAYREALEHYPDSVLAERTSLLTGLIANDRADYMLALRRFNIHLQNKNYAKKASGSYAKLAMAYSYSKMKRLDEALDLLKEIEKDTKDPLVLTEIAVRRGDFNFYNKKFDAAIDAYEKAAKEFPQVSKVFPSAYFNKMEAQFWKSKFKESHKAALDFAQYFPSHEFAPYALTRVGELLDIMGADQTKSVGAYLETHFRYGNSPKTIVAKLHLMSTKMKNMKGEELEETIKNMDELAAKSELDNIDQFKVAMLADGYSKRKDFTKAIEILSNFYQANPNRPDVKQVTHRIVKNVGDELKNLSDKGDYKDLLKTYKEYADTWLKSERRIDTDYFLGLAYENAGAYDAALEKYNLVDASLQKIKGTAGEKELYINQYLPTLDSLYLRLAKSKAENNNPQESYQFLEKIQKPLELSEQEQVERVALAAQLYEKKGDTGTSIRYLSELSNLWGGDEKLSIPVQFKLAEMQVGNNDQSGAIKTYEKCKNILVKNKNASEADLMKLMNAYTKVLVDQKRPDQAIDMMADIIGKFDQYPFSQERYQLGDLLFSKGEIKKAEVVWEKIPDDEKNIWKKLSQEKLKQASWDVNYKKHIMRIPAMAKKEEAK
ncbi:MAG: tetratricopeptide repeat protein [Pseudobdellovibrio sp.]